MSGRPYGRAARSGRKPRGGKTAERCGRVTVRLRGREDRPFSTDQLRQALFQFLHEMEPFGAYQVKNVALYFTAVDGNGEEVSLNGKAVWNVFPYRSAADDLDTVICAAAGPGARRSSVEIPPGE